MNDSVREVIDYLRFHVADGKGLTAAECERVIEELS